MNPTINDRQQRAFERMNAAGTDDRALNLALDWVDRGDRLDAARDALIDAVVDAELYAASTRGIGCRDAAARAATLFEALVTFMLTGGGITDQRAAREATRLIVDRTKDAELARRAADCEAQPDSEVPAWD